MVQFTTHSPEETEAIASQIGKELPDDAVICLFGELGAGKTTFVRGLAEAVTGSSAENVSSPTFVYLNIYPGRRTLYHFDLYRLKGPEEFLAMGFDEVLFSGGVSCIEWSERIATLLPATFYRCEMEHQGKQKRLIRFTR